MNPVSMSPILLKATNCFYITLNSTLQIEAANQRCSNFFGKQKTVKGTAFSDFLNSRNNKEFTSAFDNLKQDNSIYTLAAPYTSGEKVLMIEWNICAIHNKDNILTGYELLGVLSPQSKEENIIQQYSDNDTYLSTTKKNNKKSVAEITLNKNEKRLRLVLGKLKKILDSSLDMICTLDENGKFTNVSAASKEILGYKPKELIGKNYIDFVHKDDLERSVTVTSNIKNGIGTTNFENKFYKKDGSIASLVWSSRWEEADEQFYSIARDAKEKKASEAALIASEEKYRILFYNHPIPSWIYDLETLQFLEVNNAAINHYGYSRDEFLNMPLTNILFETEINKFDDYKEWKDREEQDHHSLWTHKKKNGDLVYADVTYANMEYNGKKARLVLTIDRTEQTIAEQELRKINERYLFLSEATFDAIWDWDLKTNEVQWNESAKKMFGISDTSSLSALNWWSDNLHDEDRERVKTKMKNHISQGISNWEDEYRFKTANDVYKYIYDRGYIIYNENNEPVRMIGAMQDLTERKTHENLLQNLNSSLEKRAAELAESNAELERFAYVTSHDLQEPLRMVTSFLQLLEKRYKEKLDQKAHEYIHYAVDGAERMKRLILDLLEYSRVNSSKIIIEDVDVNEVVEDIKFTYKNMLQEMNGTIHSQKLPVIKGNKTQILQLFQNLISNALKYKSDSPPVIDISLEDEKQFCKFKITDNGIGIDRKFFDKIFIIFQRLHNRDQYSGTGIGLAICKKIIDKHGGKIWVSSVKGEGSTFYFTLPTSK